MLKVFGYKNHLYAIGMLGSIAKISPKKFLANHFETVDER
jgi:hypothetical protein